MGAEQDPREGGLEVVEEVDLFWISAFSSNLRHYTSEAELCQARDLQTCLPFVFLPFFFLHLIIDSHQIPKPLVEGLFLYFSFFVVRRQGSWLRESGAIHCVLDKSNQKGLWVC